MKRILSLLCSAALVFSLTACGSQSSTESTTTATATDYSNSQLVGEVTDIVGTTLTLTLGELTEVAITSAMGDMTQGMGDGTMPQGEMGEMGDMEDMELPEGATGEGGGMQMQGGQQMGEGTAPTDTEMGDMAEGDFSSTTLYTFTAGEETATIDISGAEITDALTGNITEVTEGDVVVIVVGDNNAVTSVTIQAVMSAASGEMGVMGEMSSFGGSSTVEQGTAANEITEDGTWSNIGYISTGDDENALRITGATVTLDTVAIDKSEGASSNSETGDFYGMNAALLVTDGANVTMTNCWIESSAQNGNGVFCYGTGTVVTISDTTIITTADNSGGIQTTGGGTTYASNLTIETSGSSSAAIRSDRGGGTVQVTGGTYTSNGYNSPAVYSTADITVVSATLTANNSEALVIEGENSITLEYCDVSGNMSDTQGSSSDINVHMIMIYQSQSGDAEEGTSQFSMTGGSLTNHNGDVFYITNTACTIYLCDVSIVNEETDGTLMTIAGNDASHGWGTAGANGGQVEMTADGQLLEGAITVDSVSTLSLTLANGSVLTGTINIVDNAEGGTAVDNNAVIILGAGCTWNLTGDCTITSLENNGTINFNGYTITLADGTVLSD